jgi:hypothetical protein
MGTQDRNRKIAWRLKDGHPVADMLCMTQQGEAHFLRFATEVLAMTVS